MRAKVVTREEEAGMSREMRKWEREEEGKAENREEGERRRRRRKTKKAGMGGEKRAVEGSKDQK